MVKNPSAIRFMETLSKERYQSAEVLNEWDFSSLRLSASLILILSPPATATCKSSSKACGARKPLA